MKILPEKELAIKRAIIKAVESGHSAAKLADGFGVSKSTIYKYRRILRDQGFIRKNENDAYIITANRFSSQAQNIATSELDLEISVLEKDPVSEQKEKTLESVHTDENNANYHPIAKEYNSIKDIPTNDAMEQRLQDKIEIMRNAYDENEGKGLMSKFLKLFKR